MADAFVVDIMLNANGQTHDTLCRHAETIVLDGIPIKTVDLESLLLIKQTTRDQDIADRLVIEQALAALRENPEPSRDD